MTSTRAVCSFPREAESSSLTDSDSSTQPHLFYSRKHTPIPQEESPFTQTYAETHHQQHPRHGEQRKRQLHQPQSPKCRRRCRRHDRRRHQRSRQRRHQRWPRCWQHVGSPSLLCTNLVHQLPHQHQQHDTLLGSRRGRLRQRHQGPRSRIRPTRRYSRQPARTQRCRTGQRHAAREQTPCLDGAEQEYG